MVSRKSRQAIPARSTTLPRILRRFYIASGVLALAIAFGTLGFRYGATPAPSWDDSLYMTLITISTVGYSEVVPLDSFGERMFAGLLSLAGFGVITFLFTSLTVFFLESDLDYTLRRRRMEKEIRKLRGHYIICGFGRVGGNIARELVATRRSFMVIDADESVFSAPSGVAGDCLHLVGDASDDEVLLLAGIEQAAGVFAVTGDDSHNLMIVLSAKHLNPSLRVVARCHDVRHIPKLRKAGADAIVSPDFTGGMRMASAMVRPHVVGFLDEMLRSDDSPRVEEVVVPAAAAGFRLGDLRRRGEGYVIIAVREADGWLFNPQDSYLLAEGQVVIAMASAEGRAELEQELAAAGN